MSTVAMSLSILVFLAMVMLGSAKGQRFLATQGSEFRLNGDKVYLSGMNIAWHDFGMDFGEGRYDQSTGGPLEAYLRDIAAAGGNSVRMYTSFLYESSVVLRQDQDCHGCYII